MLLDGGIGTELEKSGVPMNDIMWSAQAMLSHPQNILDMHESYIRAGAEVILTNTFSSARHMLEPAGYGDAVEQINRQAVEIALQARNNLADGPVAIAGSICEWVSTDDDNWDRIDTVRDSLREQAEILMQAGVDLIAFEMCQAKELSCASIEAVLELGLPIWLGVSAQSKSDQSELSVFDYPHRDFESLVQGISGYPAMILNVMHTPIQDIDAAVEIVRRHWDGPVGVYPESGYFTMPNWNFVDVIEPNDLVPLTRGWVDNGVRLVGGCCGLGPAHISALHDEFKT